LRTLPKRRWDELKEEYLAYQKRMLDELVAFNDESYAVPAGTVQTPAFEQPQAGTAEHEYEETLGPPPTAQGGTTFESEFPLNCLAFVRNIHAESNKRPSANYLMLLWTPHQKSRMDWTTLTMLKERTRAIFVSPLPTMRSWF